MFSAPELLPVHLHHYTAYRCSGLGILPAERARVPPGVRVLEMMRMRQQSVPAAWDAVDCRPLVAVAGCGMSGIAVALALQQRGMRVVIYEKDLHFDSRSQGYGLTIQQVRARRCSVAPQVTIT